MSRRDHAAEIDAAKARGWTATLTRKGHIKLTHPCHPGKSVFTSSTPSDPRATKNLVAMLRRVENGGNP